MRGEASSSPKHGPLLAWPGARNLRGTLALSALYALLFAAVYGGADFITGHYPRRFELRLPWDAYAPFVPAAAPLYLSINLILGVAPFVFRRWTDLLPLFMTLAVETLVAGAIFLLVPANPIFPPPAEAGIWGPFYRAADAVNLERNEFPSLHVALALTAAGAYSAGRGAICRTAMFGWAGAIVVSTMLIHAHGLIDIAGGMALAAAGMMLVYPRVESRRFELGAWIARLSRSDSAPADRAAEGASDIASSREAG